MKFVEKVAVFNVEEYADAINANASRGPRYTVIYEFPDGYALGPLSSDGCLGTGNTGCQSCFTTRINDAYAVTGRKFELDTPTQGLDLSLLRNHVRELLVEQRRIERRYPRLVGNLFATIWYDDGSKIATCRLLLRVADCKECFDKPVAFYDDRDEDSHDRQSPRSPESMHEELQEIFVDPHVGLIPHVVVGKQHGLSVARAAVLMGRATTSRNEVVHSWGRGKSPEAATSLAILESLERWSGNPPEPRLLGASALRCRQANVPGRTLSPKDLWEHRDRIYNRSERGITRFHPEDSIWWRRGHSLMSKEAVYLPFSSAYFAASISNWDVKQYVQDNTNGMAVGQSIRHAVFNGLLELIERDAFLSTWWQYNRVTTRWFHVGTMSFPKGSAADVAARRLSEAGFHITVGIVPSIGSTVTAIAIATSEANGQPRRVVAAASYLTTARSVCRAVEELAPTVRLITRLLPRASENAPMRPSDVSNAMQHWLFYAKTDGESAWSSSGFVSPEDTPVWRWADHSQGEDSGVDRFDLLLSSLLDEGFDPIVVDLTRPELNEANLKAVKVYLPGAIPLTFGYGMERLERFGHNEDALPPHPLG